MKKTDLRLGLFNGVTKREPDGTMETFYMIGMNTVYLRYNEITETVSRLKVNGTDLPLDNEEIIKQFNQGLTEAASALEAQKKPGIKVSDLNLSSYSGISKREPDGTMETFYLIGMNTIRLRYNGDTGIVEKLTINGTDLPIDDKERIKQFNDSLDEITLGVSSAGPSL